MSPTVEKILQNQADAIRGQIKWYQDGVDEAAERLRRNQAEIDKLKVQLADIEAALPSKDALAA